MTREEHQEHSDDFAKGNISAGAFVLFQQIRIGTLEAQLRAKDEKLKELGEIIQQYLIPSKNYEAEIRAKDEEIARLKDYIAELEHNLDYALKDRQ